MSRTFKPKLVLIGRHYWADGLGRIGPSLALSLKDSFDIYFYQLQSGKPELIPQNMIIPAGIRYLKTPNEILNLSGEVIVLTTHLVSEALPTIVLLQEPRFRKYALTMIEGSLAPDSWIQIFNSFFDFVLVPSEYLITTYRNSGLTKPIFVAPLPLIQVDEWLAQTPKTKVSNPFTFGCLSEAIPRKCLVETLKTFSRTFSNKEKVEFRIHCRNGWKSQLEMIKDLTGEDSRIKFSTGYLNEKQLESWRHPIDCYVLASAAEGFSLTPREMIARGIPTIISSGSSHDKIIDEEGAIGIKIAGKRSATYELFGSLGYEWLPDFDDLSAKMLDIFFHWNFYQKRVLENRKKMQKYSLSQTSSRYTKLLLEKQVESGYPDLISFKEYPLLGPSILTFSQTKLNLGAGEEKLEGYLSVDKYQPANYQYDMIELDKFFPPFSIDEIRVCHSLNHLDRSDVSLALKVWLKILKLGGRLWVSVPDMAKIGYLLWEAEKKDDWKERNWKLGLMYGGQRTLGAFHHVGFTTSSLKEVIIEAGFEIKCVENKDFRGGPAIQILAEKPHLL